MARRHAPVGLPMPAHASGSDRHMYKDNSLRAPPRRPNAARRVDADRQPPEYPLEVRLLESAVAALPLPPAPLPRMPFGKGPGSSRPHTRERPTTPGWHFPYDSRPRCFARLPPRAGCEQATDRQVGVVWRTCPDRSARWNLNSPSERLQQGSDSTSNSGWTGLTLVQLANTRATHPTSLRVWFVVFCATCASSLP